MGCLAQIEERFSPAWWFADVPKEAIGSMQRLENLLPLLRQAPELTTLHPSAIQPFYHHCSVPLPQPAQGGLSCACTAHVQGLEEARTAFSTVPGKTTSGLYMAE